MGLQFGAPDGEYRCGAWLLDLPGCFVAGEDESTTLNRVPAAMRDYLDLLRRHAIAGPPEPYGAIEVVERFVCYRSAPDYEVDPTFAVDEGSLEQDEVAFARTALIAARADLLGAAAAAGPGAPGDRSLDEVLHHVATAEWWYGTRLEERPERYRAFGRFDEPDPGARLAAVRLWTLGRLDALRESAAVERVHRGERWTARKVLRRYLYHELVHRAELAARGRVSVV